MTDPGMDALQLLIRARMQELHRSYGEVARVGGLPRSTVHHLATHGRSGRLPNPTTLERLAAGLDLPLESIRTAAAQAAGLGFDHQPVDDPEIDVLGASLGRPRPARRRQL